MTCAWSSSSWPTACTTCARSQFLPPERQQRMARETLDIFAPLANRLGIWQLKWQLEDLAFRYLDPDSTIANRPAAGGAARRAQPPTWSAPSPRLARALGSARAFTTASPAAPSTCTASIARCRKRTRDFDQIYDLHGIRIIVKTRSATATTSWASCTACGGPSRASLTTISPLPKDNGYQSLHTAVMALDGKPLEVQIRTEEMHQVAEYGVAAHWRYKEGRPATLDVESAHRPAAPGASTGRSSQTGRAAVCRLAPQGRSIRRAGVCVHPQGRHRRPAARLDAGGLCLH